MGLKTMYNWGEPPCMEMDGQRSPKRIAEVTPLSFEALPKQKICAGEKTATGALWTQPQAA